MQLTSGITISAGDTVTRQTIYNLLANAVGGTVDTDDLEPGLLSVFSGTGETSGVTPGALLYDHYEALWKVYTDVLDGTGVSLWLAFGPDRFDDAFLAMEPIPPGAAVQIPYNSGNNRQVSLCDGDDESSARVVALCQSPTTVASGTWFVGAVQGIARAWCAYKPAAAPGSLDSNIHANAGVRPVPWTRGALGGGVGNGPGDPAKNWIVGVGLWRVDPVTTVSSGNHLTKIMFIGPRYVR